MRILILLILGMAAGGAIYYGLRLLWQTFHPQAQEIDQPTDPWPAWLKGRSGQLLALLALLIMIVLVLYDVLSTQEPLQEHQPPPPVSPAPQLIQPTPAKPGRVY